MQWSTLWGEVAADFPTANEARVIEAAKAAYHEFMHARQWSYREITVASLALSAGVAKYTLLGTAAIIPDFDGLIDVGLEMSTGAEVHGLVEVGQADFDDWFGHVKTNAEPAVYCLRGGAAAANAATMVQGGQQQIQLAPPPIATATKGQALQISYFRSVATMEPSANTDIPLIPAQHHYALIVGAHAYMHMMIGNAQKAAGFRKLFQERIAEAAASDMGMRLRSRTVLVPQAGAAIYPITGQSPATFDPQTRPYDKRES